MEEKVSIIVPVYNTAKYLRKCLDSICNQTYSNIEVIIVDDGSTDESPKICDEYQRMDSRVKVIHKKNEGLSSARNDGIEASDGAYIMFADSDDWLEPDMVEYLYTNIKDYDVKFAVCGYYSVKGVKRRKHCAKDNVVLVQEEAIRELTDFSSPGYIPNPAWIQMIERSVMEDIRFPKGRVYEDTLTTYKVIENVDRILVLKEPKYNYLRRRGGITGVINEERINLARCYSFEVRYCDLVKRYPELKDIMLYKYLYTYTKMTRDGVSDANEAEFLERREFFRRNIDDIYNNPYVNWIERKELPMLASSDGSRNMRLWMLELVRMMMKIPVVMKERRASR